jgi:hypothetical protein
MVKFHFCLVVRVCWVLNSHLFFVFLFFFLFLSGVCFSFYIWIKVDFLRAFHSICGFETWKVVIWEF